MNADGTGLRHGIRPRDELRSTPPPLPGVPAARRYLGWSETDPPPRAPELPSGAESDGSTRQTLCLPRFSASPRRFPSTGKPPAPPVWSSGFASNGRRPHHDRHPFGHARRVKFPPAEAGTPYPARDRRIPRSVLECAQRQLPLWSRVMRTPGWIVWPGDVRRSNPHGTCEPARRVRRPVSRRGG